MGGIHTWGRTERRYGDDGYNLSYIPQQMLTMPTIAEKRTTNIIRQG